ADVKAGLERIFAAHSPLASYYRVIAGADALEAGRARGLAGVTAPDEHTLVIALTRRANDLPWLLALPAASAVPPGLPAFARPSAIAPSGPYRLAGSGGYVPERSIHLIRNQSWVASTDPVRGAWVDEITFEAGLPAAQMSARAMGGGADLIGDDTPVAASGLAPDRIARWCDGCLRYLFMNTRVRP